MRALPIEERVEALKSFYRDGDTHTSAERNGDDFCLIERNCPFFNVAMQRPVVCDISVNAMSRLLGFQVEREKSFQNGDGCCTFRVHSDRPVDPATRLTGGEGAVKSGR